MTLRIASVLGLAALTVGLAIGSATSGGPWRWVGLLAAALLGLATVRNWRLRVVVAPEELTVANIVRTHHFRWVDVDRAGYEDGVYVRLRSGRQVGVSAFADVPGALPMVRRRNAAAANELQAAVKRRQGR